MHDPGAPRTAGGGGAFRPRDVHGRCAVVPWTEGAAAVMSDDHGPRNATASPRSRRGRQRANAKPRPTTSVSGSRRQEIKTEKQTFTLEVVAREIETPWGLAFLPDGRLLVTERAGRSASSTKGKSGAVVTVTGTPKVWERQDGGLFDVEVHPQYAKNGWIYLSYAEPLPNYTRRRLRRAARPPRPPPGRGGRGPQTPSIPSMTTIVRGKIGKDNAGPSSR